MIFHCVKTGVKPLEPKPAANWFHGCVMSEAKRILESGLWKAGLWHEPSLTSPSGIYLANSPSAALDRAAMIRGYAATLQPHGVPNAWDVAVAIGFRINDSQLRKHHVLKNGVILARLPLPENRAIVSLNELPICELWIHLPTYKRFNELSSVWPDLVRGDAVLCRACQGRPDEMFKSGHGSPWSCARISRDPHGQGWVKALKSKQWRCPWCTVNTYRLRSPLTREV